MQRIQVLMRNALLRIRKSEQTAGQVWPGVAFEFKHHRLGPAFHPDFAEYNPFDPIVNLTAHYTVMNPKSHAPFLSRPAHLSRRNLMKVEITRNPSAAKEHRAQLATTVSDFTKMHGA